MGTPVWARELANAKGFAPAGGDCYLGLPMTLIVRSVSFARSLLADRAGSSSIRFAFAIGLSASAVLILVRVGAAVAAGH